MCYCLLCCAGGVVAKHGLTLYLTYSSLINAYLSNNLKDTTTQLVDMLSVHGQSVRHMACFYGVMSLVLQLSPTLPFALVSLHLSSCLLSFLSANTIMQVLAVLNGLLDHIQRDKALCKSCGEFVSTELLAHWPRLTSWWKGRANEDAWLSAISLLRRMIILRPVVCLDPFS